MEPREKASLCDGVVHCPREAPCVGLASQERLVAWSLHHGDIFHTLFS